MSEEACLLFDLVDFPFGQVFVVTGYRYFARLFRMDKLSMTSSPANVLAQNFCFFILSPSFFVSG